MKRKQKRNLLATAVLTVLLCCSCCADTDDLHNTDSDMDLANSIKPVEYTPLSVLNDRDKVEHLFPDFELSEISVDSKPFYKLSIPDHDTFITVDGGQTELTIHRGQNTASIPLFTHLFPTAIYSPPVLSLVDLTNNGQNELLYIASDGGTGAHDSTCRIFDLTTLAEYSISDIQQELGAQVEVKPVSILEKNQVLCEIKIGEEKPVYGVIQGNGDALLEDYTLIDSKDSSLFYIWLTDDGELWASVVLTMNGAEMNSYLCEVKNNLVFHDESDSFVLGPKHELSVYEVYAGTNVEE